MIDFFRNVDGLYDFSFRLLHEEFYDVPFRLLNEELLLYMIFHSDSWTKDHIHATFRSGHWRFAYDSSLISLFSFSLLSLDVKLFTFHSGRWTKNYITFYLDCWTNTFVWLSIQTVERGIMYGFSFRLLNEELCVAFHLDCWTRNYEWLFFQTFERRIDFVFTLNGKWAVHNIW